MTSDKGVTCIDYQGIVFSAQFEKPCVSFVFLFNSDEPFCYSINQV